MTRRPGAGLPSLHLAPGSGGVWLRLLLSRLAERLRDGPMGEALLLEQWWDGHEGEVRLLPFSSRVWLALDGVRAEVPVSWTARSRDAAPTPPRDWPDSWFEVVPSPAPVAEDRAAGPSRTDAASRPASPASPRPPSLGAGGLLFATLLPPPHPFWTATQTHWIVARDGAVHSATRGRLAAPSRPELDALEDSVRSLLRRADVRNPHEPAGVVRTFRPGRRGRRAWASGARPRGCRPVATPLTREGLTEAVPLPLSGDREDDPRLRHGILLGASGSGKTSALAQLARTALLEGQSVVVFDVHGDLAPRVVAQLPAAAQDRVLAIDASGAPRSLPGVSVFGPVPAPDRATLVAHLVAAFKRLSTESGETYWGFRLERIFETFLHVVQEAEGDLVDLWSLLTDPRRREAARLATSNPELARFLDELDGLTRRQPEFLWPAASRVAKLVASPLLTALLAPTERGLPVDDRLRAGASVIWRLPIGELGPEGVTFAVTLLLTRVYLEQVRRATGGGAGDRLRVLFVLDEAHLFPSRLLSEIIAEGRKFGLGLVAATQYPARLAPELREAVTGAAGTVTLFRVPWATAAATGAWAGLPPAAAEELLPALPAGWALVGSTGPSADRRLRPVASAPPADMAAWQGLVQRTDRDYGAPVAAIGSDRGAAEEWLEDRLLLGLVALQSQGGPVTTRRLLEWVGPELEAERTDPLEVRRVLDGLARRAWVRVRDETGVLELSHSGADRIGITARTGARPESLEHRALLVEALRIFARRHERLEILRQGRFDTRLPDGRVTVLPSLRHRWTPSELQAFLDQRRTSWLWHAFEGRDVYVEAEVSGASRRERIERDWTKAHEAGAALLVLVSDLGKARSVRRVLQRLEVPRLRGTVWVLPVSRAPGGSPPAT